VLGSQLNHLRQRLGDQPVAGLRHDHLRDDRSRYQVIPTDGRPHVGGKIRQPLGNSVGHWEGDELVVETTNFTTRRPSA
jgi:hypothetical protein